MKVKICGLMGLADVELINEAMPDYAGFVFAPGRHQIDGSLAKKMRQVLCPGIPAVGVFVDETVRNILQLVEEGCINSVQLHGRETPEFVEELKDRLERSALPDIRIIKAIRMGKDNVFDSVEWSILLNQYKDAGADYFLFDSLRGGSGQSFAWEMLPDSPLPFFLAGGLQAENLVEAICKTHPFAVDISSGAETNGCKDREKIRKIMQTIRELEKL